MTEIMNDVVAFRDDITIKIDEGGWRSRWVQEISRVCNACA